ncbi:hypothetical protein M0R45_024258 [Rubus argutus]|uniref:Uncharacterized protein n=1 Tax=Rubus argutus TaxID=59490 RepID=A0AAW1WQB5_RUBAR
MAFGWLVKWMQTWCDVVGDGEGVERWRCGRLVMVKVTAGEDQIGEARQQFDGAGQRLTPVEIDNDGDGELGFAWAELRN